MTHYKTELFNVGGVVYNTQRRGRNTCTWKNLPTEFVSQI